MLINIHPILKRPVLELAETQRLFYGGKKYNERLLAIKGHLRYCMCCHKTPALYAYAKVVEDIEGVGDNEYLLEMLFFTLAAYEIMRESTN